MLPWHPLPKHINLKACTIMNSPVVCVRLKENVSYIFDILQKTAYNGFPVVDEVDVVNINLITFGCRKIKDHFKFFRVIVRLEEFVD